MVDVTVENDRAIFNIEGLHKLWAFRSRLAIPLAHITGVEVNPDQARHWWHGIKLLGADGGPVFTAGLFYYHGEMVFWDVNDPAKTVIVSLEHEAGWAPHFVNTMDYTYTQRARRAAWPAERS